MARERFNFKTGQWEIPGKSVEKEAELTVTTDEIEPTVHPCDGKVYTSSTKFRETTAAHDCVEYGDQLPSNHNKQTRAPVDGDIRASMEAWESVVGHKKDRGNEDEREAQRLEVLERLRRG